MRHKSKKVQEAEKWVDDFIAGNGVPPTYEELAFGLNISKTAAYHRCTKFRDKMKLSDGKFSQINKTVKMSLTFVIPNNKFKEFSLLLRHLEQFLEA